MPWLRVGWVWVARRITGHPFVYLRIYYLSTLNNNNNMPFIFLFLKYVQRRSVCECLAHVCETVGGRSCFFLFLGAPDDECQNDVSSGCR